MPTISMPEGETVLGNLTAGFTVRYGSAFGGSFPTVCYLRGKARITPTERKKSYEAEIDKVKEAFDGYIRKFVERSGNLDGSFLYTLDISGKNMSYGKKSFLKYDIYLRTAERNSLNANRRYFAQCARSINRKLERLLSPTAEVVQ